MSVMDRHETAHVSRLRQSLVKLRDETARLMEVFLSREPLVRGSVYELRRKCGKPTCACAAGVALHACMVITWSDGGKKRLRSLSPKEEMELTQLTERYRHVRRARAKLVAVHSKIIDVIDELETTRRKEP
jgi:hypothetical protein